MNFPKTSENRDKTTIDKGTALKTWVPPMLAKLPSRGNNWMEVTLMESRGIIIFNSDLNTTGGIYEWESGKGRRWKTIQVVTRLETTNRPYLEIRQPPKSYSQSRESEAISQPQPSIDTFDAGYGSPKRFSAPGDEGECAENFEGVGCDTEKSPWRWWSEKGGILWTMVPSIFLSTIIYI